MCYQDHFEPLLSFYILILPIISTCHVSNLPFLYVLQEINLTQEAVFVYNKEKIFLDVWSAYLQWTSIFEYLGCTWFGESLGALGDTAIGLT